MSVPEYRWHFGVREGSANYGDNPVDHLFKDAYKSLVREVIQNSIDVPSGNGPVIVSFNFGSIESDNLTNFFDLEKYIVGGKVIYSDERSKTYKKLSQMEKQLRDIKNTGEIQFLKVSDSNTLGMDYKRDVLKTKLCAFAYNLGGSSKPKPGTGGSFGFGKATYFGASPIRTVFVSTRDENNRSNYVGVTWLCTSKIGENKYEQAGYYTLPTETNPNNEDPVAEINLIPETFRRKQQGSSFFIMGAKYSEKTLSDIYEAAIFNFWYPILKGELVVEVQGKTTLDSNSIRSAMQSIPAFSDEHDSRKGHTNPRPYFEAVMNKGNESQGFYYETAESEKLGKLHFFLCKRKDAKDRVLFMRKTGMLIFQHPYGNYGYYGVFVCEGDKGNILLQSAENPAHNEWDAKNCEYDDDKPLVRSALKEIEDFIQSLVKKLFAFGDSQSLGINGLEQYAYIQSAYEETPEDQLSDDNGTGETSGESSESGFTNTTMLVNDKGKVNQPESKSKGVELVEKITTVKPSTTGEIGGAAISEPEDEEPTETEDEDDAEEKEDKPEGKMVERNEEKEYLPQAGEGEGGKNKESKDGVSGTFMVPIKTKKIGLRTFLNDNLLYHQILVQTSRDIPDCTIKILVGGEDSDEELEILESSVGEVSSNAISKLSLSASTTNVVNVRFEDNMIHSLIVSVYENK